MDDADLDMLLALADEAEDACPTGGQQRAAVRPSPAWPARTGAHASSQPPPSGPSGSAAATPQPPPKQAASGRQVADGYVDSVSGFRVSKPVIGSLVLRERLTDDCVYLSLKDISPSREQAGRWATMAVLVSKAQATGRDGSSYSRWTLSDLAGKQVTLFLWRKAAAELYKEQEGSLLLLWSPQVRRDESGGGSGGGAGYSLHIDKPEMVQRPGMSADFGLCRGTRKDGQQCTYPINRSNCEYCPYHAQAALRALSSNRSDMAGANLLQRQLLPQARAAQKHMADAYGRPMGGINSLIARPPPKTHPSAPGSAASRQVPPAARASSPAPGGASAAGAGAGGSGTGAYGTSADYAAVGGAGGAGGTASGGKRSYGAQLLANMKERQAAEEVAGPAAKRRRSEGDLWDDTKASSVSASKARAIAAARATGQLTSQKRAGDQLQPGSSTGSGAAATRAGAAVSAAGGSQGGAAASGPTGLSGLHLPKPPPLPPSIAGLLKPSSGPGPGAGASGAGKPKAAAGVRRHSSGSAAASLPRSGSDGGGQAPAANASGASAAAAGLATGRRASDPGGVSAGPQPAVQPGPMDDDVELDGADELEIEPEPEAVQPAAGDVADLSGTDGGANLVQAQQGADTENDGAAPQARSERAASASRGGGGSGAVRDGEPSADAPGDGACGLDELLELFPELQEVGGDGEEAQGNTDADLSGSADEGEARRGAQPRAGAPAEGLTPPEPLQHAQARPAAVAGGGGGGGGRGLAPSTGGAPAAGAAGTGLLPRVPGLAVAPSARAAEARKQQAAAVKARAEKLKSIGLKPAAGPPPPPKPLGAANSAAAAQGTGAYGGAGRAPANSVSAAAAALAAAKGLPQVASRARSAAAAAPAAVAAAPVSAMAAAFGNIVQQLPEAAVESRYSELSEDAAGEAVLSMLEGLEARDALVQQLESVTHLKVTAWHCAQCERLYEYMDKQCRADGHTMTKTTTLKRFWTCDHCNARITTLGVRFPANRCSRCNNPSLEFTACSMYRGPRELKPAGMAAASGLACKENLFSTLDQHPEMGRRTFR